MSRLISKIYGLLIQLFIVISIQGALGDFINSPILTIFTIFILCVSISFTQVMLTFTLTIELFTLGLLSKFFITVRVQYGIISILIFTWIISITIQALVNII